MIGEVRRELAFIALEKKKIHIRAMIQLAASELAERENGEFSLGGTVALPEFRVPMFEHAAKANFRDLRKLRGGFLKRRYVRKFPKCDSRHLTAFPKTQRSEIFF